MSQPADIDIARAARLAPMAEIAAKLGIPDAALLPFGRDKAKLEGGFVEGLTGRPDGKLILVTAISPTPAGEGKTTTTVGLGDALNRIGKKTAICLREPSLGPCFGMKGGAAGGGHAQIAPMEDINLHFTGDFHAISTAHNLLAAMVDNHLHWGGESGLDPRRVSWGRVLDMNDRALRHIALGLGGPAHGVPRESGFDIAVASEVMAIFCLAETRADLARRLGEIIIGWTRDKAPVRARDLKAEGAMAALLAQAIQPNLVQTLECNPAFVHGGPFANIAHGCNSVIATKTALKLADYTVTEAGFGADLGAEKFLDIKCRKAGLAPDAAVIVATARALKMNGGLTKSELGGENIAALARGLANLARHIDNMRGFGLPVAVAINRFDGDSPAEIETIRARCAEMGVEAHECRHWAEGGAGAESLARHVAALADASKAEFRPLYADDLPLAEKIETIATRIYRAASVAIPEKVLRQLQEWDATGWGDLPICIAKTQYSFSADPSLLGAPEGHVLPVREVRLNAGAGFVVAICGDIMTMPGLPRRPAAEGIGLDAAGLITGLF